MDVDEDEKMKKLMEKKDYIIKDDTSLFEHIERVKKDMPKLLDKKRNVKSIGNELVNCQNHCDGIQNNPEEGILPRCLIFEGRIGTNGAIVVGLNPGKAN